MKRTNILSQTILYFGNDWSAENRTSSHHIARCLAKKHRVYYIECPGMRAPRSSGRDLMRIVRKIVRALAGPKEVEPNLSVQTLLQIPWHRFGLIRRMNAKIARSFVRWLMWRHEIRQPIAWFVAPHVASLSGELDKSVSVYYCTDDHASMPNMDAKAIRAMDERLTREADLVFVASDTLLDAKRAINPRTFHSPHGVDVEHFRAATDAGRGVPEELAGLQRPLVGFFGLIEQWIDLDLVAYLARQRPDWNFVMIGRVAVPPDRVPALPNMHFLGKRPYESLPNYGRAFTAAIIPYRMTQQVFHANPLKLREYLAMGKPVVSVSTPETEKFADVIEIAHGRDDFLTRLDKVVRDPGDGKAIARRIARVASSSWDARVEDVLRRIEELSTDQGARAMASLPPSAQPGRSDLASACKAR